MPSEKRLRQRANKQVRMAELRRAQQRRRRMRVGAVAAVIVVIFVVLAILTGTGALGGSSKKKTTASTAPPGTLASLPKDPNVPGAKITGPTPCPNPNGSSPRTTSFAMPPPSCLQTGKSYTATFTTNLGTITVALNTTKTPETANNFIVLALYHYYDGTQIFRTAPSIGIVQGGSPDTQNNNDPGPGYTIKDEGSGYTYVPGDLVMARTQSPNSAGGQYFFCVTAACSGLNNQGNYVVFGTTTSGLPVLQKILSLDSTDKAGAEGPRQPVTVTSVKISES